MLSINPFEHYRPWQAAATSVRESYGSLNLLINASGILSIPDVLQPGFACTYQQCGLVLYIVAKYNKAYALWTDPSLVCEINFKIYLAETTLTKVEKSSLLLAYEVNAIGPVLVIKVSYSSCNHMWPLLKVGGGSGTERKHAVVASLSARVGSIGDNGLGGWHSYRASKTALNQCMRHTFLLPRQLSLSNSMH
ncbi:hypothetical protein BHE74_00015684 [Ensete ventricosum]|nr:hypothetical protein GW17_00050771 [Ensete ventricosum]RWW76247.1 hypothetical protein BHE74_00015684 [Ensete ventricosum]